MPALLASPQAFTQNALRPQVFGLCVVPMKHVGGWAYTCAEQILCCACCVCACAAIHPGLEEGSRLPAALQLDPGTTGNAAVRSKLQQLPASLTDALKCWDSDSKLQAAVQGVLGADLIKAFIAVRHCEVEANPKPQDLLLRY